MERAEYLVLKMLEQLRRNGSKAQLMDLLKDLQEEIDRSFPSDNPAPAIEIAQPLPVEVIAIAPEEEKIVEVLQINEDEIDWEQEENPLQITTDDIEDEEEEINEPEKEPNFTQVIFSTFLKPPPEDALLNPEFIEEKQSSEPPAKPLESKSVSEPNDKWGNQQQELFNRLAGSPIKDIKKAIGINDRYRFIQELFKGDENMYERSLKTINDFSIYPEAEFWVRRELKIKLGWNTDDELVQLFDQLVRRRFS